MAVEFSAAAKAKFDQILTRYPTKRAAIMSTLWLAQRVRSVIASFPSPRHQDPNKASST